jgi:hypothetical protein
MWAGLYPWEEASWNSGGEIWATDFVYDLQQN